MDLLIHELENWRPDVRTRHLRQDLVMAMWFCWLFWQQRRANIRANLTVITRKSLPWSPTGNPMSGALR
jgi:hypothetical protein